MCNVLSSSIIALYNKYAGYGLFDLNIRKYIRNKMVDSGINETLDRNRENFWFLNNGITIACDNFDVDGDTVWLEGFSIVNGGQTTYLIGNYKGSGKGEFYIPCKIVAVNKGDADNSFFTKIAEAVNSQKPIYARDLKSNNPAVQSRRKHDNRRSVKCFHEREEDADRHMVHAVFIVRNIFLIAGVADFRSEVRLGQAHFFPVMENLFGNPLIVFLVMRGLFGHLQSSGS